MLSFDLTKKLPLSFYERDAVVVAKELLGKIFVRKLNNNYLIARIIETEAYKGDIDLAAHSYNGKTERNSVMFNNGGFLYVYFTYGMHYCANVVTGPEGNGDAVLLRGLEPLDYLEVLSKNRYSKTKLNKTERINLTNGPAKFCKAFDITKTQNGTYLINDEIFILDAPNIPETNITTTTRIGIKKSVDLPWRFYITDNSFVSKK